MDKNRFLTTICFKQRIFFVSLNKIDWGQKLLEMEQLGNSNETKENYPHQLTNQEQAIPCVVPPTINRLLTDFTEL